MQLACRNWVMQLDILWVVNELDMQYFTSGKKILCKILIFNPNIMVFKTNIRSRFKMISKKKGYHLKLFLRNALFVLKCSDL